MVCDDGGELVSDVHHRECRCVCTTPSHEVTSCALGTRIWVVTFCSYRGDAVDRNRRVDGRTSENVQGRPASAWLRVDESAWVQTM